ncbi:hypothetical protein GCM10028820_22400 [Tessaracoccus terricola]
MKNSRRFAGVGAALLTCPYTALAVADPTPEPTPVAAAMSVVCPAEDTVAAALGRQVTSTFVDERECQYSVSGAGLVLFRFETTTLLEVRTEVEASTSPLTEVSGLTPGAFAVPVGNNWVIHYQVDAEAATLVVPTAVQSGAVTLAEAMLDASTPLAAPSEPTENSEYPGMPSTGN